jgi:hypothetical protein
MKVATVLAIAVWIGIALYLTRSALALNALWNEVVGR